MHHKYSDLIIAAHKDTLLFCLRVHVSWLWFVYVVCVCETVQDVTCEQVCDKGSCSRQVWMESVMSTLQALDYFYSGSDT